MSVQAMSWVIDNSKHSSNEFVVLLMIANHAKSDGTGAWPSVPMLAKEARCSEKSVQRAIQALVASGELKIDRESAPPHKSRIYSLPKVGATNCPPRGDIYDLQGRHSVPRNKEEPSLNQPSRSTPDCFRCYDTGYRASYSTPGVTVRCECRSTTTSV